MDGERQAMIGGRRIFPNLPLRRRLRPRKPHFRCFGLQGKGELLQRRHKSGAYRLQHGFFQGPEAEEYLHPPL